MTYPESEEQVKRKLGVGPKSSNRVHLALYHTDLSLWSSKVNSFPWAIEYCSLQHGKPLIPPLDMVTLF